MKRLSLMIAAAVGMSLLALPCRAQHTHDHAGHSHKHLSEKDVKLPKDYAAAVARIKKCRAMIGEEIAAGHYDDVHAPLDEATILSSKLMILARDSGIPKAQWQEINLASKDLKKRFGDLHAAVEAHRTVNFKAVSAFIDQNIRRLELVATASGPALTR